MPAPVHIRSLILASTSVTSLVSTRVHYNHVPQQSARPNIWFRVTSDNEQRTLDKSGGLHEARCDIECVGVTETSAQAVADAVKNKLDGYKGSMGTCTAQGVFVLDKDDDYIPFSNEGDDGLHVVSYELHLFYTT